LGSGKTLEYSLQTWRRMKEFFLSENIIRYKGNILLGSTWWTRIKNTEVCCFSHNAIYCDHDRITGSRIRAIPRTTPAFKIVVPITYTFVRCGNLYLSLQIVYSRARRTDQTIAVHDKILGHLIGLDLKEILLPISSPMYYSFTAHLHYFLAVN
jgi:hypothetical protein